MNMNNSGPVLPDHKKVLDAIVLIKNKEFVAKEGKEDGAPKVDLESIVRKVTERKEKSN